MWAKGRTLTALIWGEEKKVDWLAYHMCHRKDVKERNEEEEIRGLSMGEERCASD